VTCVLAVGAHPDDVELGCGGALARHRSRGDAVTIVVVTDGRLGGDPQLRALEQRRSAELLGADLICLGHPDGDIGRSLANELERIICELAPGIVYTHRGDEIHQDHRQTVNAVRIAGRDVRSLLLFESPRSPALTTGVVVDIGDFIEDKIELVACHKSQIIRRRALGEEAVRARAILHGIQSGFNFAEQFEPVRFTWNMEH
jgi:LmbE family N-acetylglucosaminyl deacetylase